MRRAVPRKAVLGKAVPRRARAVPRKAVLGKAVLRKSVLLAGILLCLCLCGCAHDGGLTAFQFGETEYSEDAARRY